MPSDPDGLWPRRSDDAIDAPDEQREVDDVLSPADEENIGDDEPRIDADDRPVAFDDTDDQAL